MSTVKTLLKDKTPDLKKLHNAIPQIMKHPKKQKTFIKLMTETWSEDEDTRRILAFLNILKAVASSPACLGLCIKTLFSAYVRNCKFVLGSTMAHINFMRMSLLELFANNLDEAYVHAFFYIRQLAIGLRKAYASKSKDDIQGVQNWPFVQSLRLWTDFVAKYSDSHSLIQSLGHPLVQLLVGVIKLNSGERWLPLRFHCVSMLHVLAGVPTLPQIDQTDNQTATLIGRSLYPSHRLLVPSLPLLLDTFQLIDFNRRASNVSKAALDLRLLLHFSPSQRQETGCLDAICSWLCDLLTEAAAIQANSVAFPEFALPLINELKQFAQTCRVASFTRQMKTLQVKLSEHSSWITNQRRRLRSLTDTDQVVQLESSLSNVDGSADPSPFLTYYLLHKKVRAKELARLTESHKKDALLGDPAAGQGKFSRDMDQLASEDSKDKESDEEEDSDDSGDSDESYDMDDGTSIVHVSKSKRDTVNSKSQQPTEAESDSESDFDLKAALEETEAADLDDTSSDGAVLDDLAEFELSDSDGGSDGDVNMEDITLQNHVAQLPNKPVPNGKRKIGSKSKKGQPGAVKKAHKHTNKTSIPSAGNSKKPKKRFNKRAKSVVK